MIFKRKIYEKIVEWNNSKIKNSAILIEGARRIGKTTIVESFANEYYKDNYLYIDFKIASDNIKNTFNDLTNLDSFFEKIFILSGKGIQNGGLIIFDEVQFCPRAREAIKYLVKDGRFSYIETGSLISIKENTKNIQIPSEERRLEMYPLDFEEFLWANNDSYTADYIRSAFNNKKPIDNNINKEIMNKFRKYLAVGGMPKVLDILLNTNSYYEAELEKRDILSLYKDDLRKHDMKYKTSCEMIFDAIPYQLSKESSRFFVSNFDNKRVEQLSKTLFDLSDFKLVNIVYNFSNPASFFELSKNIGLFKIYPVDTGLLVTSLLRGEKGDINSIYEKIIFDEFNYNFGPIFESISCQMLVSNGVKPYYHTFKLINDDKQEKNYEIDFMYQSNFKNYALEIKSTKRFKIKSLDALNKKYKQLKFERYIVSPKTFNLEENDINIPIYMLAFI